MNDSKPYWFRAKRYGWGWGLPLTWQGWVAYLGFFAVLAAGACWLLPRRSSVGYVIFATVDTFVLFFVCYLKGEPPAWRWGKK
jgi:hypothetical protein